MSWFIYRNFTDSQNVDQGVGLHPSQMSDQFVRAGVGNYWDANGVLQEAAINEPRLDYDNDGNGRGLLYERTRENICLYNRALDNAAWGKDEATVSSNDAVAPNGLTEMDKLVESINDTPHFIGQNFSFTSGEYYVLVAYIQPDERDEVRVDFPDSAFAASATAWFDLTGAGAVGTLGSGMIHSIIEKRGDGYLVCALAIADATTTGDMNILMGDGGENASYDGDGTSGLHIWGATYIEWATGTTLGTNITKPMSSIIYTEGSAVERSYDNFISITLNSEDYPNEDGDQLGVTGYFSGECYNAQEGVNGGDQPYLTRLTMTKSDALVFCRCQVRLGATQAYQQATPGPVGLISVPGAIVKFRFRATFRMGLDQTQAVTYDKDTGLTGTSAVDTGANYGVEAISFMGLYLGNLGGANTHFEGWIEEFGWNDRPLSTAVMQDLVRYGTTAGIAAAGTMVDANGRVQASTVDKDATPNADDVFIEGTRHTLGGRMYITTDAVVPAEVKFLAGIAHHSVSGVRYTQVGSIANELPDGFAVGTTGAQAVTTDPPTVVLAGIGRDVNGSMCIENN